MNKNWFWLLLLIPIFYGGKKVVDYMSWNKETKFDDDFRMSEQYNDLPPNLIKRMAWQESHYDPNAVSPVGAKGLLQFMEPTWKEWGYGYNIFDPKAQIAAAGRYIRWLYDRLGSWEKALAAYNWGIGNVSRKGLENAPLETRNYYSQILKDISA